METVQVNQPHLAVFDFDGTIANVPERPQDHEPKHGWNGKDWWGSEHSLSAPHYDGGVNEEVIEAFRAAKADPNTHAIVLTGRRGVIAHGVRNVLRNQGLYGKRIIPQSNKKAYQKFRSSLDSGKDEIHPLEDHEHGHHEYFSGDFGTEKDYPKTRKGKPDGSTIAFKLYVLGKMVHEGTQKIDFWDDREDHIAHITKFGTEALRRFQNLQEVWLHRVIPPKVKGGTATILHIPIHKQSR